MTDANMNGADDAVVNADGVVLPETEEATETPVVAEEGETSSETDAE